MPAMSKDVRSLVPFAVGILFFVPRIAAQWRAKGQEQELLTNQ